ncbi:MAG: asparaginase domain-containing protein [Chloroflexi bacterium OHK40]
MPHILIITTGGTISTRRGPSGGGAVPLLKSEELTALLPRGIELAFEEFTNVPGSHFTPASALTLARRVEAALQHSEVAGVVVTHGVDTLEETAYLIDLVVTAEKPVALTGAARPPTSADYDGVANLAAAIRVAASPAARGLGALIVFAEQIHAAAAAQMVHAQAREAFASPGLGPLGRVEGEQIWIARRPVARQQIACPRLEEPVDLLRLTQGADVRQLRHSIEDGVPGIVLEAFGGGRLPPWWLPQLSDAIRHRIAVVIASRCGAGGLGDEHGYVGAYHDLRRAGVLFAPNLSGPKARIKLMAALGAARSAQELRAFFS